MPTQIAARKLLTEAGEIDSPVVTVEDGKIAAIETGAPGATGTLTAAFFDVHVHGACSFDLMAATPREIDAVGRFLAGRGVAHYLPTTVTGPIDTTLGALERLANAIEAATEAAPAPEPVAVPVGIHLEGPFISHAKRGVHPAASIQAPSVELFERFRQAARGHIRLVTLAPEMPGALELVEYAAARGVRVSIGHSNAKSGDALAAIAAGATSATHIFNAMRALDHREPGIAGTVLDSAEVYAEAICDGVHVHPAMIRLWLKAKGEERAILVTDGMSATGMPDGVYALGGFPVEVKGGVCLLDDTLAGSVLTMDKAVANLREFTGASLRAAVRLAAHNPARMLGMEQLASLAVGAPANFNLYDDAGVRVGGWLRGQPV